MPDGVFTRLAQQVEHIALIPWLGRSVRAANLAFKAQLYTAT